MEWRSSPPEAPGEELRLHDENRDQERRERPEAIDQRLPAPTAIADPEPAAALIPAGLNAKGREDAYHEQWD